MNSSPVPGKSGHVRAGETKAPTDCCPRTALSLDPLCSGSLRSSEKSLVTVGREESFLYRGSCLLAMSEPQVQL